MLFTKVWYRLTLPILLVMAVWISGCSQQESAEQVGLETEPAAPQTRILSTMMGDVTVPLHPERVVVDWNIGHVLAVGVTPVGVPGSLLDYGAFLRDKLVDSADLGNHSEISLERMVELEPDLIITWDQEKFQTYSKIAPTVVYVPDQYDSMEAEVTAMGEILNREVEAKEWNTTFKQRVADAQAKIKGVIPEGATFTVADFNFLKNPAIIGNSANRGGRAAYELLGLTPAPKVKTELLDQGQETMEASAEVFGEYVGDYLLMMVTEGTKDHSLLPDVWASLPAVKNNHIFKLDIHKYFTADPYTSILQAEEIADRLVKGQTELN
ncbi:ABC transporter substrate-binding protein [Paenibacillus xylanexedens]|uniref:ABC transporter substrate-binding protein n=1 Tax=Paenibacillus xylanexedens TaxID=528191 RepID=UPI0011A01001|nr:ABC transporter substrate-binding protein [Paenibacillus xylanexedens]